MNTGITDDDLKAIKALCPRLYAAVGWGAGTLPDWQAFRACCHPQAVLAPLSSGSASTIGVESFVAAMEEQRASGTLTDFSETELANSVEAFGNVASVRSSFVTVLNGEQRRGVTFAQIVRHDNNWLILSAIWDNESETLQLPADFT
ncbi:hypothetical protein [Kineobactrum salinum]|uniref:Nuclear transport factor 2 family protein n=1 Tax=Kineobactrum salinum TaxID=2708301 RepID=A0A6C0U2Y7_9GAMM|nr:hypothetical protein [Kineobactrum salinum]QIB66461.1 hypothetical protein G3T16_14690 [Kineobactrum salinum]